MAICYERHSDGFGFCCFGSQCSQEAMNIRRFKIARRDFATFLLEHIKLYSTLNCNQMKKNYRCIIYLKVNENNKNINHKTLW